MEKREYGSEDCYGYDFEIVRSFILDKLNAEKVDYLETTSRSSHRILIRNDSGLFDQDTYISLDENNKERYRLVNYRAWFNDHSILFCRNLVFKDGSGFDNVYFVHSIDGVPQNFKSYTNAEIIDMQINAPDHPLLQVMDKVVEMFADKGSMEKRENKEESKQLK